jgi:arsenite methyltransferase
MANMANQQTGQIREVVRNRYARVARQVLTNQLQGCCGSTGDAGACWSNSASTVTRTGADCDPITGNLYSPAELATVPEAAALASLGCGNPAALADLHPGEVVLDLGSGGGLDVLLSARRVGPTGHAYGLDMTDEMLALAERNRREAGVINATFLKGHIEDIPLPEHSVDVAISNCVINLSADKGRVLREAFRVLRPGGRLAVSDIVVQGRMPLWLRHSAEAWAGCVAGALEEQEYRRLLSEAGFTAITVTVTRRYGLTDIPGSKIALPLQLWSRTASVIGPLLSWTRLKHTPPGWGLVSAFIRAQKPADSPPISGT